MVWSWERPLSPLRSDQETGPNSRKKELGYSSCISHGMQSDELSSQKCIRAPAFSGGLVGHVAFLVAWGSSSRDINGLLDGGDYISEAKGSWSHTPAWTAHSRQDLATVLSTGEE